METLNSFVQNGQSILTNQSNVTTCTDGVQWIYSITGDCCVSIRQQISAYLGIASIVIWGFVGIPQMCKNLCHISGMAGLSIFLILQWAGGDLTNFIGCILTNQSNFQIILAIYFVVIDVFLLLQYLHFICWQYHKKRKSEGPTQASSKALMCLMCFVVLSTTTLFHNHLGLTSAYLSDEYQSMLLTSHRTRTLLSFTSGEASTENSIFWQSPRSVIGYCLGIVSALFYLGSRVSQIYKNVKAQSTAGLAFLTFTLAIFGNLTYGGQIIALDWSRDYMLQRLPWLLGSFGVVVLDCGILLQFAHYRHKTRALTEEQESLLTGEYLINAEDTAIDADSNQCSDSS